MNNTNSVINSIVDFNLNFKIIFLFQNLTLRALPGLENAEDKRELYSQELT